MESMVIDPEGFGVWLLVVGVCLAGWIVCVVIDWRRR